MTIDVKPTSVLDGYVTKPELAEQLSKSERTLDRWHELRIGPPRIVIGRTVLYRIDAVREWLQAREQSDIRAPNAKARFNATA